MRLELDQTGERLDAAIARLVPELSRSQTQRLLEEGLVTFEGKPLKKNEKSRAGMILDITLPEAAETDLQAQDIPLDIRYEDSDVIVINKPKGLVVHPAPGHPDGTVVNALLHHCGDSLSGIGGEKRPGIVHRIDKDTSGLLIAAKNDFAHAHLSAQLKDHSLARTYECIVCGNLKEDSGTIDAPIGRHPTDRKKMAVTEKNSRNAVTHWEVIARYRGYTHVRCKLETGRTHQIRVHLAWRNHPIVGDTVYGHKKPELGLDTQCLHAAALDFIHPRTGQPVHVECELPEYFQKSALEARAVITQNAPCMTAIQGAFFIITKNSQSVRRGRRVFRPMRILNSPRIYTFQVDFSASGQSRLPLRAQKSSHLRKKMGVCFLRFSFRSSAAQNSGRRPPCTKPALLPRTRR